MSHSTIGRVVKCGLLLACGVVPLATSPRVWAKTIYVDINATCGEEGQDPCTGVDWEHAWKDLGDALDWEEAQEGDEVLVADGTYHPWVNPDPEAFPNSGATFRLRAGVILKGGYAGYDAPDPDYRNIVEHPTTLSGDNAENDDAIPIACDYHSQCVEEYGDGSTCDTTLHKCDLTSENSYKVVHIVPSDPPDAPKRIIDGFTITAGYATFWMYDYCGGGLVPIYPGP